MDEEQKINKSVMKLQKVVMKDKFKISFRAVYIGFIVTVILAFLNILIYAKLAGVNIFSSFSRTVGIVLMFAAVILNVVMLKMVSKTLIKAIVDPIHELRDAVQQIKLGEFDIDVNYKSNDELGQLADNLRETCKHVKEIIGDTGYVINLRRKTHRLAYGMKAAFLLLDNSIE